VRTMVWNRRLPLQGMTASMLVRRFSLLSRF